MEMKKIYFIGINGIGMSGLAKIMKIKGFEVSGADLSRSYITEELENLGIKVYSEHDASNVKNCDTIVMSSAIKEDNPEYKYAKENNIPMIKRGELLGQLINAETGIAVAGTHGKTTTSSMLSVAMLSKDPTIVVGGVIPEIGSNAKPGLSEYFIAEADESDNSFLYMKPSYSIITNIEADHLENHGSLENIEKSFTKFMDQTTKEIIVCGDCENIKRLTNGRENVVKYSICDETADIYAKNIVISEEKTEFTVVLKGKEIGSFIISIPGEHNISNSLPVIYLSLKFGIKKDELEKALKGFHGAKRRYDVLYNKKIKVIDDYAHHPTEIKATLQGARSIERRKVTAVFQPHRYSRVNFLFEEFKNAFEGVDELYLMPIYSAGEKNIYGITLEKLKEKINHSSTIIIEDSKKIQDLIEKCQEERVFLFMGAGDISKLAHKISENLEGKNNENI